MRLPSLTPEERELRELKVAASAVKLVEARREPGGWVVRVQQKTSSLSPKTLQEAAQRFFRELARTGLPVLETSFEARTDSLRDVWGHRLEDVPVFRVALSGETFARINWNGFDPATSRGWRTATSSMSWSSRRGKRRKGPGRREAPARRRQA